MLKTMRKQGGFTLIEVVAAAALIGIMATMLLPSLSGANDRVKNARLQNDLVTIDQAIQLYKMDAGTVPAELTTLTANIWAVSWNSRMPRARHLHIHPIQPTAPIPSAAKTARVRQ